MQHSNSKKLFSKKHSQGEEIYPQNTMASHQPRSNSRIIHLPQNVKQQNTPLKSEENQWQKVVNKRRYKTVDGRTKNQKTINDQDRYWPGGMIQNATTFLELHVDEDYMLNIEQKMPPIFISSVKNIVPLIELFNEIGQGKYLIKNLHNNKVRIQPTES